MTYEARETSLYLGAPFELYLFQTGMEFWALTSGDVARSYNSKTYTPESVERTESSQSQENNSGEIQVTIPRTHDIASRFVSYIPASPMSLVIYRGHDGDPDSETVANFTGKVIKAEFLENCILTVAPERKITQKSVPVQKFQPQCNWVLFQPIVDGAGCGVSKPAFRVAATISEVSGDTIKSAAFDAKPDGWFNSGYIEMGEERRMILAHVGDALTLISPMASIVAGVSLYAYAGCRRNCTDCETKFNNLVNFWGFDQIPTKNPFDGGLE